MNDRGGEAPCWSRGQWARLWLSHGDPAAAALELEPGDDLPIDEAGFPDLARALCQQGLTALFDDGHAYVYTPEKAQALLDEIERDARAAGQRLPPASSPAPVMKRRPARSAGPMVASVAKTAGGRR